MPFNPLGNPGIGFLWSLPKKAVRLAAENFRFHPRNAVNENRRLLDVIGTNYIAIADDHERGNGDIAQPVRGFPITTSEQ